MLRATKNLIIFSASSLEPKKHPKILVWRKYQLFRICVGSYLTNGRFFRFFNLAWVLVQPWTSIFMSKFERIPILSKKSIILNFLINYVYFKNMYHFFLKIFRKLEILRIFEKFFFQNFRWIYKRILIGFLICQKLLAILCATCPNIKIFIWDTFLMHKMSKFWLVHIFDLLASKKSHLHLRCRNAVYEDHVISLLLDLQADFTRIFSFFFNFLIFQNVLKFQSATCSNIKIFIWDTFLMS